MPEPKSNLAEITCNSEEALNLNIYKITTSQYSSYLNHCIESGFSIESEQSEYSYQSFNTDGYKLDLSYLENENVMHISLEAPEQLDTLVWSDTEMAKLIPIPNSSVGRIDQDDESEFSAYIGDYPLDSFNDYVRECSEKGFDVNPTKESKSFSAMNSDGYRLSVIYTGNNHMQVTIMEPEYEINIKTACEENLIFNKYDVKVFIDDWFEGTIEHGQEETFSVVLKKGSHKIRVVNEEDNSVDGEAKFNVSQNETIQFNMSCTSSQVKIENLSEKTESKKDQEPLESSEPAEQDDPITTEKAKSKKRPKKDSEKNIEANLTIDNCPELADMLSNTAEFDESYSDFAEKYSGRTIEFDGRIDYCTNYEDYNTRFDYLVSSGDYDPDHQIGPYFKFENVNYSELNTDLDEVTVGLNVHIIAEVVEYNSTNGLFFLEPISVTSR